MARRSNSRSLETSLITFVKIILGLTFLTIALRILVFCFEHLDVIIVIIMTVILIYKIERNSLCRQKCKADPDINKFVSTYIGQNYIWPSINVSISAEDILAFGKILEKRDIHIPVQHLTSYVNEALSKQQLSHFWDSYTRINPELLKGRITKRQWASAYVNAFENSTQYMQLATQAAPLAGLRLQEVEFQNLVQVEIYRRAQEKRAKEIELAMQKGYESISYTIDAVDRMAGIEFEQFLKELFSLKGYKVQQTKITGDQGADLILEKFGDRIAVQAKRYSNYVSNSAIQEVVASKAVYNCRSAIVITNQYFTSSARELAGTNKVELWDRDYLRKEIEVYFQ